MKRRIQALDVTLKDEDAERVRRNTNERIAQVAQAPAFGMVSLGEVSLADATEVVIPHGLGRVPVMVFVSPVRGASSSGRVEEVRGTAHDRTKLIVLKATGFGATVLADVAVM